MTKKKFAVRTLFLARFFEPGAEMADQRRQPVPDTKTLVAALKRVEIADQTLERELNAFAEKGFDLVAAIQHPRPDAYKNDLLITTIFSRDVQE